MALLKESMKAKTANKTEVYRAILTAFTTAEKENGVLLLLDSEYTAILRKMAKVRWETAQVYTDNSRPDLATKEAFEAAIIEELLPQLLTGEAAQQFIFTYARTQHIALTKANMGKLVKDVVAYSNGRLDGKTASTIIMNNLE